jgi:hypothetical protein
MEESDGRDGAERENIVNTARCLNRYSLHREASSFGSVEDDRSSRPEC